MPNLALAHGKEWRNHHHKEIGHLDSRFFKDNKNLLLTFLMALAGFCSFGQDHLHKSVKLHIKQQKLGDALDALAQQGGFHFSYSTGILATDSLVSLQNFSGTVKTALTLFLGDGYEYQQSPQHLIIRPAPFKLTLLPEEVDEGKKVYTIKGYVLDENTGLGIHHASVYEKRLLVGTTTDKRGHFKLRLKSKAGDPMVLTISKELYKDTTTVFLPTLNIGKSDAPSKKYAYMDRGEDVSQSGLARFFLSTKQKLNALNIGNFFAYMPVQVSFTPGLSSQGVMSSQVVNKFSTNLIGGYTAGLDGVELAGVFNVDRFDVKYLQVAGVFNNVGGRLSGVQLAGVHNRVIDSLTGLQVAGISNIAKKHTKGMQLAGIMNVTDELQGLQVSGLINKAKHNKGLQFGIINIADTSSGVSLGLINLTKTGIKRLTVSTNEVLYARVSFKSGNAKLYSIVSAGYGTWNGGSTLSSDFGMGHAFNSQSNRHTFALELVSQQVYAADYNNVLTWPKLSLLYHYPLTKTTNVYLAPSLNYIGKNKQTNPNIKDVIATNYPHLIHHDRTNVWIGLELGFSFF